MLDAIVVGAGPAGSAAALVMARAGARVLIVDRERFPRHKLCGDTLNPGALRILASLELGLDALGARRLGGMILSGPRAIVRAGYDDAHGLAVTRHVLDAWLLGEAVRAGARFEGGLVARRPLVDETGPTRRVRGAVLARRGHGHEEIRIPATMTIAADGRGSVLGRALGLVSHPPRPRRWAFGAYMTGVGDVTTFGEMHIHGGGYIGIAPIDDERVNVCVVTGARPAGRSSRDVMTVAIQRNRRLRHRFGAVEFASPVAVLGPLAVNASTAGATGILLAGDAAGFIDPMTGDGMNLAMRGGVLAAREALRALETGDLEAAVGRLGEARRRELGAKLRFNRFVRGLVSSPLAVEVACWGSLMAPAVVRRAVRYAGDAA